MLSTTDHLYETLQARLASIKVTETSTVTQLALIVEACKESVQELKSSLKSSPFADTAEEIQFFKTVQPRLFSELIYYTRLFFIETHRPSGSTKFLRKYFKTELEKIDYFFTSNKDFYNYHRTGATHFDTIYFQRNQADTKLLPADLVLAIDPECCTVQSYKLARLLANERLQEYLNQSLLQVEQGITFAKVPNKTPLKWTGSKVALIELIYAIQTTQVLNGGQADIKLLTGFFESMFDTQLGNVYHVFQEMRLRKKNRTTFLDQLKERLVERMDLADE